MSTYHILYNRLSRSNTGELEAHMLDEIMDGETLQYHNTIDIDYDEFFATIKEDDKLIVAGGDGTLNQFINRTDHCYVPQQVFYFPAGSGNDFARDIGFKKHCEPFEVKKYLYNLPSAKINNIEKRFFNSISIGIDALVAKKVNELKKAGKKNINYATVAVQCVLKDFSFCDATVTDEHGNVHEFKDVLLAITNKGSYFGGGIKIAPQQDRNDKDEMLTFIVAHGLTPAKALVVFASILVGKHFSFKKNVTVMRGKEFTVKMSKPTPIQMDGENILGETGYYAAAKHTFDLV